MTRFKVGDIVKLKNGSAAQEVIESRCGGTFIRTVYLSSVDPPRRFRNASDFEYYDPTPQYDIFETPYGHATVIGQRRDGAYVVETLDGPRGRSCLQVVTKLGPAVKVYTVKLENIVDKYTFHRQIKKGVLKRGDLIKRDNGKLYRVIGLDTNSPDAQWLDDAVLLKGERL